MCAVIAKLLQIQHTTRTAMAAMADINIYYKLLKMVYGRSTSDLNIRSCLAPITIVFGSWHGYKHAVEKTYEAFRPLITALEYESFLIDATAAFVTNHPTVLVKEKVLPAIFFAFRDNDEVFQKVAGYPYAEFSVKRPNTSAYTHNSPHVLALFRLAHEYISASEPLYATVYVLFYNSSHGALVVVLSIDAKNGACI